MTTTSKKYTLASNCIPSSLTLTTSDGQKLTTMLNPIEEDEILSVLFPDHARHMLDLKAEIHTGPDGYSEFVPTLSDKLADLGED